MKELDGSNSALNDLLGAWFNTTIGYLHRTIQTHQENISIIIEEVFVKSFCFNIKIFIRNLYKAFSCGGLDLKTLGEQTQTDLNLFFNSFDCSQLVTSSNVITEKVMNQNSSHKLQITHATLNGNFLYSKQG